MAQITARAGYDVAPVLHGVAEIAQFSQQTRGAKGARAHVAAEPAGALLNGRSQDNARLRGHRILLAAPRAGASCGKPGPLFTDLALRVRTMRQSRQASCWPSS